MTQVEWTAECNNHQPRRKSSLIYVSAVLTSEAYVLSGKYFLRAFTTLAKWYNSFVWTKLRLDYRETATD